MNLTIAAVGRQKNGPSKELYQDYVRRIRWPLSLREVEERRPMAPGKRKTREAELLLKVIAPKAVLVVLDEGGRSLSSQDFAARLGAWQDEGQSDVVFVIGGADGLSENLKKKASLLLCLGAMTWPHMLVRTLLAEQIFRGQSILSGHPYHRDG